MRPRLRRAGKWYLELLDLLRVRARTIDDIVRQAGPYFLDHIEYDPEAVAKQWKNREEAAETLEQIGRVPGGGTGLAARATGERPAVIGRVPERRRG